MNFHFGLKSIVILLFVFTGSAFESALPQPSITQSVATDSTANIPEIEKQAFVLVNEHRKSIGLTPLLNKGFIADLARLHSREMASGKVNFGHDGADERFKIISKSIKGMEGAGENVFTCTGNYSNLARTALDGWLESQGHRENIEGDYNLSGMGVARADDGDYYFTQIFVKGTE